MPLDIRLSTEHLILRPVATQDLDMVHHLHSLPETDRYNTMGIPAELSATETVMQGWFGEIAQGKKYVFVMEGAGGSFIGLAGMNIDRPHYAKAEIWYKLFPEHWGKGLATETVRGLLQFGFRQLSLHRIEAGCATENAASARVLQKAGFIQEGLSRKVLPIRGEWKDGYNFG
ncbi:MAG TPA: GNAT family N-acetyltransferase, partial [Chitinophagaceae bacterium]|nr:GNAT family N-acetyltransferase [Chitinophagaceae bacterium]